MLRQRGKGSCPGCRDPRVWRQERGQKTGQIPPRRDPRERVRSLDRGSLEKRRRAATGAGPTRAGAWRSAGPRAVNPHQKGQPTPRDSGKWQSLQKEKPLLGQTLPPHWGKLQLCRGTSPCPGAVLPPCCLTHHMPGRAGRIPEPLAVGHREELGLGRRPQAWGRPRRQGPGSSPLTGDPVPS